MPFERRAADIRAAAGAALRALVLMPALALAQSAPAAALDLAPVAPGAYVARGSGGMASRANGGHIANAGVLVGPTGVVVIDAGPTAVFGARLRDAIGRLTDRPVVLVINTHPQAETTLANGAFPGAAVIAHPAAAAFMRERCSACLATLREQIGDAALAGTSIVVPSGTEAQAHAIAPGGRHLRLLPFGPAASIGDLAVLDVDSGTLFTGALALGRTVPDLRNADLAGWRNALAALRREPIRRVVPGVGAPSTDALSETAAYLDALDALAAREVADGADLATVAAPLPAFADWPGYAEHHAANLRRAFVQAEARWLNRP